MSILEEFIEMPAEHESNVFGQFDAYAKKMGIENNSGLTNLLMGQGAQLSEYRSEILPNWYILPSGEIPPNPSELLGSTRMEAILKELKEKFDYIVIDLPPVNIVSDALSISGLITGMVVVIREEYTEKKELERCFRQLELSNVKVLGCVMNESRGKTAHTESTESTNIINITNIIRAVPRIDKTA